MKVIKIFIVLIFIIASCSLNNYTSISVSCHINDEIIAEYLCKENTPIYKRCPVSLSEETSRYERVLLPSDIEKFNWVFSLRRVHSTSKDDSSFYEDPNYYKGTVRDFDFDLFRMNSVYYGILDTLLMWGDVSLSLTDSTIIYRGVRNKIGSNVLSSFGLNNRKIKDVSIKIKNRLLQEFVVGSDKDTTNFLFKYSKDTLKEVCISRSFTQDGKHMQSLSNISYEYRMVKIKDSDLSL